MPELFSFNDEYISCVAGGGSDEDTLDLFSDAFSEMVDQISENLPKDIEYEWDTDGFYALLDRSQMEDEFGIEGEGNGAVRRSFIQSRLPAERAFAEVLHG